MTQTVGIGGIVVVMGKFCSSPAIPAQTGQSSFRADPKKIFFIQMDPEDMIVYQAVRIAGLMPVIGEMRLILLIPD
jgi:hypothetical protein